MNDAIVKKYIECSIKDIRSFHTSSSVSYAMGQVDICYLMRLISSELKNKYLLEIEEIEIY